MIEEHVTKHSGDTVYDALLLPALTYAERDRVAGRLTAEEERGIVETTRELIGDAEALRRTPRPDTSPSADATAIERVTLLGLPAHTEADRLALEIFAKLLEGTPFVLQVASRRSTRCRPKRSPCSAKDATPRFALRICRPARPRKRATW